MNKITIYDLKKLGLDIGDSDDIYIVSEINQKLDSGDVLGAFDVVSHAMAIQIESLKDEIEELEDDLDDTDTELEDVKDDLSYAESAKEDAEERINYLEDILDEHNISY